MGNVIILTVTLLVFFIVLVVTVYLYQVKKLSIRYQLTKFSMRRRSLIPNKAFLFDAFISYSSKDIDWVVNELMSQLEGGKDDERFKVCVHERDFRVGRSIAENIITNLVQSVTCILVLTKEFTDSYWCNFEAHAANQIFQEQNRIDNLVKITFQNDF